MGVSWPRKPSPSPARDSTASLTMTHQHLPGMSVIAIGGEVDHTTSAELAGYIDRVRRPGDDVIFDLTELSFLDSAGLQVLLACIRRGGADGPSVHLAAAQGKPARLLQITGIDAHLPVHATVEQAITAVLTSGQSG